MKLCKSDIGKTVVLNNGEKKILREMVCQGSQLLGFRAYSDVPDIYNGQEWVRYIRPSDGKCVEFPGSKKERYQGVYVVSLIE